MWHLTGFSGVRESFLMDLNGTFDSTLLLTPDKNLPWRNYSKFLDYAPKYDGDVLSRGGDP